MPQSIYQSAPIGLYLGLVLAAVAVQGGQAQEQVSVGTQVRLTAGHLSLNHDASHLTPPSGSAMANYGDPTSVLSYDPLNRADIELVIDGRGPEHWFDLVLGVPLAAGGTFADRDYTAGPALFSETFSTIALGSGGSADLRMGLPVAPVVWNEMSVRPYWTASMALERYEANGLSCGTVCPSGPLGAGITVIGQDLFSASAGLGVWLEREIADNQSLDMRFDLSGGYLGVSDSHYFRIGDLGPVPNISYDFATFGASGELAYRYETQAGAILSTSVFADGQLGLGQVVFGSSAATQSGALPAWSVSGRIGASLGASISF